MSFGGPIQKRGSFRLPHWFKLPSFGGRLKWPVGGGSLPWGLIFRVLVVLLPVAFIVWECGKARTYMPYAGFWTRTWFVWTDTTNMIGNAFEGVYRFATKGDSVAAPFFENDWPRHVLVCRPVEVNGVPTQADVMKRKLHIAEFDRNLHYGLAIRSGPVYTRLLDEIDKRRYPVVFLPLPSQNSYEILSHPKQSMQICKGGANPAVESHKIPVSVFNSK